MWFPAECENALVIRVHLRMSASIECKEGEVHIRPPIMFASLRTKFLSMKFSKVGSRKRVSVHQLSSNRMM